MSALKPMSKANARQNNKTKRRNSPAAVGSRLKRTADRKDRNVRRSSKGKYPTVAALRATVPTRPSNAAELSGL